MSDGDALLAAILAQPDDDLVRLVYADWLEESGQPDQIARAEIIRVQCELARDFPGDFLPWDRRRVELVAREKTLLAAHGDEWLAPLRQKGEALESKETHAQFRRGFEEVVWMPARVFLNKQRELSRRAPVRELRVTR